MKANAQHFNIEDGMAKKIRMIMGGAGDAFPSREVVVELLREQCPSGWEAEAAHIHATIALMQKQTYG